MHGSIILAVWRESFECCIRKVRLHDDSGMRETCLSLGVQCTQYAQDSTQDSRFLHGFHSVRGILVCVGSR